MAADLDYVPMPDSVKAILKSWAEVKDTSGKAVAFK
jgi:phosphate transport system substrate-binding protein